MEQNNKSKIKKLDIVMLQFSVMVYSLSTVAGNMASKHDFLSPYYILFFGLDFFILGVYAILWQQIIKRFQLSVAYANKAMTLLWSMVWNFLIFSQGITVKKVIGVLIVMVGVVVMNMGEGKDV
ncbi:MAG: transporter [Butyrivibrio sp.]|nr:transporter [Butyrivibrio sp.]